MLLCAASASPAWCQFSKTYQQTYWIAWGTPEPVSFSLSAVAEQLGTTPDELADALSAFYNKEEGATLTFQLQSPDGVLYPNDETGYTQGTQGGFWIDQDDHAVTFSGNESTLAWYNQISWNKDEDKFNVLVGQKPGFFANDGKKTGHFILTYNDKQATFDVTLSVQRLADITAELQFSKLEMVGEATLSVHQSIGSKAKTYSVKTDGIAEKLGIDAEELSEKLSSHVFARSYDSENDAWIDSITCDYSASPLPGFWFKQTYDPATGDPSPACFAATADNGTSGAPFYVSGLRFADGEMSMTMGHTESACEENASYTTTAYIVHNAKAYALNIELAIDERPAYTLEGREKVYGGEYEVSITSKDQDGHEVVVPVDDIAEKLGVEVSDLVYMSYNEADQLSDKSTANNGGFWFDGDSHICSFQATGMSMYVEPKSADSKATLLVGKWQADFLRAGDSQTCKLFLLGDNKYAELDITLKIQEEVPVDTVDVALWNVVKTFEYKAYLSQAEGYSQKQKTQIDWDAVKSALGLDAVDGESLFTWSEKTEEWKPELLTKAYTCTPFPGFWMDAAGEVPSAFGDQCTYGYTLDAATGLVTWYVHPNAGKVTGDTYKCEMFLVNVTNGNVVKVAVDLEFYNERASFTTVGTQKMDINLNNCEKTSDGFYEVPLDLFDVAEKVGTSIDYYAECKWYTEDKAKSSWKYLENFELDNTWYDADGNVIDPADETAEAAFTLGYDIYEGKLLVSLMEPLTENTLFTANVAFGYGDKCYVFNLALGSELSLGVNGIESGASHSSRGTYTLSGARIADSQSAEGGIVIKDGKKFFLKK